MMKPHDFFKKIIEFQDNAENLTQNQKDIVKSYKGRQDFLPESVAEKSAAAACLAQWLLKIAEVVDIQEKQKNGMPRELKAPKTAEQLEQIRKNYDLYNASIGKPSLADFKWDEATVQDIQNFPQDVKDRLRLCNETAGAISKQNIKELKGFKHPPAAIKKVCSTAAFVLTEENDYNTFLNLSTHPEKILAAIKEHQPLQLSKAQIAILIGIKDDPEFDPDVVAKQSQAGVPITKWLNAL